MSDFRIKILSSVIHQCKHQISRFFDRELKYMKKYLKHMKKFLLIAARVEHSSVCTVIKDL